MSMDLRYVTATGLGLLGLVALQASAEQTLPAGAEFQVNTFTPSSQGYPEVASGPQGDFVVVWESFEAADDGWRVRGQRFDAAGQPQGTEMAINSHTTDFQILPSVAADGAGNFVVVWSSFGQDGSAYGVFGQRFDAAGVAQGTEMAINTYTTGPQGNCAVAMTATGEFLVSWESEGQDSSFGGIYGQAFDAAGQAVGDELRFNTTVAGEQNDVRVAAINGGFAAVWESDGFDTVDEGVVMQLLTTDGMPVGGEVQVNTHIFGDQEDPAIAATDGGSFAVVWESSAQDGQGEGVFAQVYDPAGMAVGDEMQLNQHTAGDQKNPSVSADGKGGFVAAWESVDQVSATSGDDLFGRRFDTAGEPVGDEFLINSRINSDQDKVALSGGVDGRFVAVWRAFGDQDGSGAGVFGRRFEAAVFADGFESGNTSSWSVVFP